MHKPLLRPGGFVLWAAFLLVATLTACSGGGSSAPSGSSPLYGVRTAVPTAAVPTSVPVPTPTPTLAPLGPAVAPCTDCWPMFMGNATRTGLSASTTGITSTNASTLAVRWSYEIGEETAGSPITANGAVFVTTGAGSVISFDERTGNINWRRSLGGAITMTPTYDESMIFVATHNPPAQIYALDATTGSTVWQTSVPGAIRGEPLAVGGTVVIPEAGGDPGECYQGGLHAFNELTGSPLWTWNVNSKPADGGSVWSPISYDGRYFVFGTGNTCSENVVNANSVVQLSLAGGQDWRSPMEIDSYVDDDWGGGAMIQNGTIVIANKNGYLYSLSDRSGAINWQVQQNAVDGEGSISSPASDGKTLVVPAGFVNSANSNSSSSFIGGYNLNGNLLWQVPTHDITPGGAAITNDVAIASMDSTVQVLDLLTGTSLFTFTSPSNEYFYASPAIDSTGIYNVDTSGGVFALGLPAATPAPATPTPTASSSATPIPVASGSAAPSPAASSSGSPTPAASASANLAAPRFTVKAPYHVFYTTRGGAKRVRY